MLFQTLDDSLIVNDIPVNCDQIFELHQYDMNNVYDDHDPSYDYYKSYEF